MRRDSPEGQEILRGLTNGHLAAHIAYITGQNAGCGSTGGWIRTQPIPLVWLRGNTGTIGGVGFAAEYRPGDGWRVALNAC